MTIVSSVIYFNALLQSKKSVQHVEKDHRTWQRIKFRILCQTNTFSFKRYRLGQSSGQEKNSHNVNSVICRLDQSQHLLRRIPPKIKGLPCDLVGWTMLICQVLMNCHFGRGSCALISCGINISELIYV